MGGSRGRAWIDDHGDGGFCGNFANKRRVEAVEFAGSELALSQPDEESISFIGSKVVKRWSDGTHTSTGRAFPEVGNSAVRVGLEARRNLNLLDFTRVKDFDFDGPPESAAICVHFHHKRELALSASADSRVNIFRVDGKNNKLFQTLSIENVSIKNVEFSRSSDYTIICGKGNLLLGHLERNTVERVHMRRETLVRGTFAQAPGTDLLGIPGSSEVNIISQTSRTCVMKLNTTGTSVRACVFSRAGMEIIGVTDDGLLYCWDVRMQRCLKKAAGFDDTKCICLTPDGEKIITGQGNGIVSVHRFADVDWSDPNKRRTQSPAKRISSLSTSVTSLSSDPHGDIIIMSSSFKKNALRAFHVPTLSMVKAWPTSSTPLHYVSSTAFNNDGTLLAVANARGRILTYRVCSRQTNA
jgi:U3 small nucleolar RNA-associated protein 18